MTGGRVRRALPISQFLLLVMGLLIVFLVVDFGRQVASSYERQADLEQVEREIQAARQQTQQLEARLIYARSSQAAEAWAREQGWAAPDEVPIVIVAPPEAPPSDTGASAEGDTALLSYREAWWAYFFGER
jgi:cell division protein FtsB